MKAPWLNRAETIAQVGTQAHRCSIERIGDAERADVDLKQMHVEQRVDEQAAAEIGGVAANLPPSKLNRRLMK